MKKLNKNILFGLGAISAVVAPVATLVACGNSKTEDKPQVPKVATHSSNVSYSTVLDLAKFTSIDDVTIEFGNITGFSTLKGITEKFAEKNVPSIEKDPVARSEAWKDFSAKLHAFIAARPTDEEFTIKYNDKEIKVKLDLNKNIQAIIPLIDAAQQGADTPSSVNGGWMTAGMKTQHGANSIVSQSLGGLGTPFTMSNFAYLTSLPVNVFDAWNNMLGALQRPFIDIAKSEVLAQWILANKIDSSKVLDSVNIGAFGAPTAFIKGVYPNEVITDEQANNIALLRWFVINALKVN